MAGSNNQAIEEVLAAKINENSKANNIEGIYFFVYSLNNLFKI